MIRKMQPGACIFCGKMGGLSKQHIFPNRLKNLIPREQRGSINIRTPMVVRPPMNQVEIGIGEMRTSQAHPGTKTRRAVCVTCNTGWMRDIEESAFRIMESIVQTGNVRFDVQTQAEFAGYLTLFFMMIDSMDHKSSGVTQCERTHFFERRAAPSGWNLFLGRAANDVFNYRFRHYGGPFTEVTADGHHRTGRMQICTAGVGPVLMHVVSSRSHHLIGCHEVYANHFGLAAINPTSPAFDFSNLTELSDNSIHAIAFGSATDFVASLMPQH